MSQAENTSAGCTGEVPSRAAKPNAKTVSLVSRAGGSADNGQDGDSHLLSGVFKRK